METGTLEKTVTELTVKYNLFYRAFPWLHAINWKANFPFRRVRGYTQCEPAHRFEARVYENGRLTSYIARLKGSNEVYTKVSYHATPRADSWFHWKSDPGVDVRSQWIQNPAAEARINDTERLGYNRRTVSTLARKNKEPASKAETEKYFGESIWGALLKTVFPPYFAYDYLKHQEREKAKPAGAKREPYKFWNLGTKKNYEGTGRGGALFSDQNVLYELATVWFGKHYTVHNDDGETVAEFERDPVIKLLSFGLLNTWRAKIYDTTPGVNEALRDLIISDIDEVQNKVSYRLHMPENPARFTIDTELVPGLGF